MIVLVENYEEPSEIFRDVATHLPETKLVSPPQGESLPSLDGVDGVVLSGGDAGNLVEPAETLWVHDEFSLVRGAIDERVPLFGICFGHQLVNVALGGSVEYRDQRVGLAAVDFADDPLLAGLGPAVPVLHRGIVVETGAGMSVAGTTGYDPMHVTCHDDAPVWTVQFHPDFRPRHVELVADEWSGPLDDGIGWGDCDAHCLLERFGRVATGPL